MPTLLEARLNDTITRAEIAKMIVAFSQLMNVPRHSDAFRSQ
jgi:hypothetical protein